MFQTIYPFDNAKNDAWKLTLTRIWQNNLKRIHCLSGLASQLLFLNLGGTFGTTGKLVENSDGSIPREYDFISLGGIQTNGGMA